nr:hypothetical protein [Kibdelosporangium sp. MJ126-NF4]CEL23127.1 hypothetical protein [Kibdelosporangium sp. MJ126-NF4]CTQ90264.1 hypothetical protein [Kibdelosporangium sp. MJ126-NF4]
MTGNRFHVDVDELHTVGTTLEQAGHGLNDQRNRVPGEPADAGVSTEIVATAVRSLLGGVAKLLGDIDTAVNALRSSGSTYLDTEDRVSQGLRDSPGLDLPFMSPTRKTETDTPWWTR